jgi:hypothetical protein
MDAISIASPHWHAGLSVQPGSSRRSNISGPCCLRGRHTTLALANSSNLLPESHRRAALSRDAVGLGLGFRLPRYH